MVLTLLLPWVLRYHHSSFAFPDYRNSLFQKSRNYAPLVEQISKICQPVNIPWIKEKEKLLPLSYKYVEHFKEPTDKTCLVAKKTLTPKIRKQKLQVL